MTTIRFILAIIILVFAVYIVALNWGCVIAFFWNKRRGIKKHYSTVPVVSFVFVALADVIYPYPSKSWMLIIPLLDIANWSLLWLPVALIRDLWKKAP